jgi:hypothetical protein
MTPGAPQRCAYSFRANSFGTITARAERSAAGSRRAAIPARGTGPLVDVVVEDVGHEGNAFRSGGQGGRGKVVQVPGASHEEPAFLAARDFRDLAGPAPDGDFRVQEFRRERETGDSRRGKPECGRKPVVIAGELLACGTAPVRVPIVFPGDEEISLGVIPDSNRQSATACPEGEGGNTWETIPMRGFRVLFPAEVFTITCSRPHSTRGRHP